MRSRTAKLIAVVSAMAVAMLAATAGTALALPSETPDETPMVDGPVRTIEQVGTNVWVGGNFDQVKQRDGTVVDNVSNVAVFDSETNQYKNIAPKLGAGSTTSNVRDIAVYGNAVLIAGDFAGPTSTQKNLVAVDGATGEVLRWYNSSEKLQSVLGAPALGRIYGGGVSLSAFEFESAKRLWTRAKITVDASLRPHTTPPGYRDLELDGSTIWGACACDAVDGAAAKVVVKLDTEGNHDVSFVGRTGPAAFGISVVDANGALYLGAGSTDFLAQVSKADGRLIWRRDTSGSTQAVEEMDGGLVVGGHFWEVADEGSDDCGFRSANTSTLDPNDVCQTRKGLAAYSFGGVLDPNWDPAYAGAYLLVWALHPEESRLHTGGEFLTVGGVKQTNYARLSVDVTPPTVSGVVPAGGATGVEPSANVTATFSEAIDPATISNATFTLTRPDGTAVAATVGYDPTTKKATLNPDDVALESRDTYTATIKGGSGGVKDLAGNALASDKAWSFTTTAAAACTISGTPSAETLTGTPADDVICAGEGNDTLNGLEGNDTLKGEGGTDKLFGGAGDDTLDGGIGLDIANFSGSPAAVNASLVNNTATGEGSDVLAGVENLVGSNQADALTGSGVNNNLYGGGGADTLTGLAGADALTGVGADDTLDSRDGVEGNDSVDGGFGTDVCQTDATERSILNCEQSSSVRK